MAEPANVVIQIRDGITQLLRVLETVPALNNKYVDLGGKEFVEKYLLNPDTGEKTTDITPDEFVTGISNIQELQAWLDAGHRAALMKLSR